MIKNSSNKPEVLIKVQKNENGNSNAYMDYKTMPFEVTASRNMQHSTQEDESKISSPNRTVVSSMID